MILEKGVPVRKVAVGNDPVLVVDWSPPGLCHELLQKYCMCEERLL